MQFERVIVAVDFSAASLAAPRWVAMQLASRADVATPLSRHWHAETTGTELLASAHGHAGRVPASRAAARGRNQAVRIRPPDAPSDSLDVPFAIGRPSGFTSLYRELDHDQHNLRSHDGGACRQRPFARRHEELASPGTPHQSAAPRTRVRASAQLRLPLRGHRMPSRRLQPAQVCIRREGYALTICLIRTIL